MSPIVAEPDFRLILHVDVFFFHFREEYILTTSPIGAFLYSRQYFLDKD